MVHDIVASGGILVSGCRALSFLKVFVTAYGVGDILYNISQAKKGVLEKVIIKKIVPASIKKTFVHTVLYKDLFNALWNEWELVDFTTAQALAEQYHQHLLDEIDKIDTC